jgi:hypothetical protein
MNDVLYMMYFGMLLQNPERENIPLVYGMVQKT